MWLIFLIAVSLSMDAFSLSLMYGTLGMSKSDICKLSFITGFFHLFMPFLGCLIGMNFVFLNSSFIIFIILFLIGVSMVINSFKDEEVKTLNLKGMFLFALAVSIDSFSVGITLKNFSDLWFFAPLIFSLVSGFFTFWGLILGGSIKKIFGAIATILGGLCLIVIAFYFLFC